MSETPPFLRYVNQLSWLLLMWSAFGLMSSSSCSWLEHGAITKFSTDKREINIPLKSLELCFSVNHFLRNTHYTMGRWLNNHSKHFSSHAKHDTITTNQKQFLLQSNHITNLSKSSSPNSRKRKSNKHDFHLRLFQHQEAQWTYREKIRIPQIIITNNQRPLSRS